MGNCIATLANIDVAILELEQAHDRLDGSGAQSSAAAVRTALASARGARDAAARLVRGRNVSIQLVVVEVLRAYSLRVANTNGKSFEAMAAELIDDIDMGRVERAARERGPGDEDQARGAFDEVRSILVELQVLEF